ncbi:inorganic phosphate transporter [Bogoriella caseilytica]|uniref:PiT family inorganic phosphate transporter n=1 Tax=Bogoriella caseilytica TaxID=56055 RepID=A0A3N2BD13_9MICO|nr:inorganic phosphate transporter [Bogoriella caseilytica]ROR73139.1 PiT family inorganic phosphate transporter [Bogoriella caseilytica]
MPAETTLVLLALAFVVITGVNDGGAILAPGLRVPGLGVVRGLLVLTACVMTIPWLTSGVVAHTLADTIVEPGPLGATALAIGFVMAVIVVVVLTRRGLPTSLSLAVIGGAAGAGWGLGAPVAWTQVGWVLSIAALAPIVGMALALLGSTLWHALRPRRYLSAMTWGHRGAFTLQCVAYGANDGQKILVLLLAAGLAGADGRLSWWWYPILGVGFAGGTMLGLPRMAHSVGSGILASRPAHVVTGEFAAATAVLGSSALGAPVSMTQVIVGALLGAGIKESYRKIRWRVVRSLALAWLLTLPLAMGTAGTVAVVAARWVL